MGRIQDFGLFLEAKEESSEVKKEVKKIISEMFAVGKNIKFSGEESVEFEIDENDYKLGYDEALKMEYSEGVLSKRKYLVSLNFASKSKEGTDEKPIYKIKFNIKLKPTSEIKSDKKDEEIVWAFSEKPTKVIKFIKSEKQSCDWDESTNRLSISKSAFKKLASEELRKLIRELGGVKKSK